MAMHPKIWNSYFSLYEPHIVIIGYHIDNINAVYKIDVLLNGLFNGVVLIMLLVRHTEMH